MHLFPQQLKYTKVHRTKLKKVNKLISYNQYKKHNIQIISIISGVLTYKQIYSLRQVLLKKLKYNSLISINVFSDLPVNTKPTSSRMGKGRGTIKHWICKFKAGTVLFNIRSINTPQTLELLKKGINKLPLKIKINA